MDEDVFSPAILPNETEAPVGFVFYGPNAFRALLNIEPFLTTASPGSGACDALVLG